MVRKYKYRFTADITVEAENIMAAEKLIHSDFLGQPTVRLIGNCHRTIKLPSMRGDERLTGSIRIGEGKIERTK